jgi:hypothetical protein
MVKRLQELATTQQNGLLLGYSKLEAVMTRLTMEGLAEMEVPLGTAWLLADCMEAR